MSTTRRSTTLSKAGLKRPAVDSPFDPAILAQAREIALRYRFVVRPSEQLGFFGSTVEMPLVMGHGKTPQECLERIIFATETTVASLLEVGEPPPTPASARRRTEQINIRLTPEEKLLLEEKGQEKGFRGLSEFVRATVLAEARGRG